MTEQLKRLLVGLADAGCTREEIEGAEALFETANFEELTKHLRRCRCTLVDKMHESQKQVDRMDYLIRQTQKMQHNERNEDHDEKRRTAAYNRVG